MRERDDGQFSLYPSEKSHWKRLEERSKAKQTNRERTAFESHIRHHAAARSRSQTLPSSLTGPSIHSSPSYSTSFDNWKDSMSFGKAINEQEIDYASEQSGVSFLNHSSRSTTVNENGQGFDEEEDEERFLFEQAMTGHYLKSFSTERNGEDPSWLESNDENCNASNSSTTLGKQEKEESKNDRSVIVPSLSEWVRPLTQRSKRSDWNGKDDQVDTELREALFSAENGIEKEEEDFARAIRRWQLHKGREAKPGHRLTAAGLAGVNPQGKFVPFLIRPDGREESSESSTVSSTEREAFDNEDEAQLRQLRFTQNRMLAKCFIRWQKFAIQKKRLNAIQQRIETNRKKRLFEDWLNLYYAVRMHRIRCLFRSFQTWVEYTSRKKERRQLAFVGEAFHELRSKHGVLAKLWKTVLKNRNKKQLLAKAVAHRDACRERDVFSRWRSFVVRQRVQNELSEKANLCFRLTGLFRGMEALKTNRRDQVVSRAIRGKAQLRLAAQALRKWRIALRGELQYQMQLEGAKMVFDVRLCCRTLERWKQFVSFQKRANIAERAMKTMKTVHAFTALRQNAKRSKHAATSREKADRWYFSRRALAGTSALVENLLRQTQKQDARILHELQVTRRALFHWQQMAALGWKQRSAHAWWERKQKNKGFEILLCIATERRQRDSQTRLAEMFSTRTLLRKTFCAWNDLTLESLELKFGLSAADQLMEFQLKRKALEGWRDETFRNLHIAMAYQKVLQEKVARACWSAWRAKTTEWVLFREQLKKSKIQRLFVAWAQVTVEERFRNQALLTAAIFRRNKLMSRCFQSWEDAFRVAQSQRRVIQYAKNHARRQVMKKHFAAWRVVAFKLAFPPLEPEGASRWHECQTLKRCMRVWKRQTALSGALWMFCLSRLGGPRTPNEAETLASTFNMSRIHFLSCLLRDRSVLVRSFRRWARARSIETRFHVHSELLSSKKVSHARRVVVSQHLEEHQAVNKANRDQRKISLRSTKTHTKPMRKQLQGVWSGLDPYLQANTHQQT